MEDPQPIRNAMVIILMNGSQISRLMSAWGILNLLVSFPD